MNTDTLQSDTPDRFTNEYGIVYSSDGLHLMWANYKLTEYTVRSGTEVIDIGAL